MEYLHGKILITDASLSGSNENVASINIDYNSWG